MAHQDVTKIVCSLVDWLLFILFYRITYIFIAKIIHRTDFFFESLSGNECFSLQKITCLWKCVSIKFVDWKEKDFDTQKLFTEVSINLKFYYILYSTWYKLIEPYNSWSFAQYNLPIARTSPIREQTLLLFWRPSSQIWVGDLERHHSLLRVRCRYLLGNLKTLILNLIFR